MSARDHTSRFRAWLPGGWWVWMVAVGFSLASCSDAHNDHSPADAGPSSLGVSVGRVAVDGQFAELPSDHPSYGIVAGFQGGYHISPVVHITDPGPEDFITVIEYTVTDVETGQVLSDDPMTSRIHSDSWSRLADGSYLRTGVRLILNVADLEDAVGRTVRIDVEVRVENGFGQGADSVEVDVVQRRACPPDKKPSAFGRSCAADGECGTYLACMQGACGWPETMSGITGPGTTTVDFDRDGTLIASFDVEVARSDLARSRGLSARQCMRSQWGMLFIHPDEDALQYQTVGMRFAIDIIFANAAGDIEIVARNRVPGNPDLIKSDGPAKYVVELRAGGAQRYSLRAGDHLTVRH